MLSTGEAPQNQSSISLTPSTNFLYPEDDATYMSSSENVSRVDLIERSPRFDNQEYYQKMEAEFGAWENCSSDFGLKWLWMMLCVMYFKDTFSLY